MTNKDVADNIVEPSAQLNLYGYENYFESFVKLYNKNKLPNVILLSGPRGAGKCTFAYHFINFLLSKGEKDLYSTINSEIHPNNKSFRLMSENIHPNFFLLNHTSDEVSVKVEKVRSLLKFLNNSTYSKDIKIVLIDNAEKLNINSGNALLKSLEEPMKKTFFLIVHDNSCKIPDTIRSRCLEFRIFHSFDDKRKILKKIFNQYNKKINFDSISEKIFFDTPGNILRYFFFFGSKEIASSSDHLTCINYLLEEYKAKKDHQLLNFASFFIEMFYNDLSLMNKNRLNIYSFNKSQIINQIANLKKFNLDKTNSFIMINKILYNEK